MASVKRLALYSKVLVSSVISVCCSLCTPREAFGFRERPQHRGHKDTESTEVDEEKSVRELDPQTYQEGTSVSRKSSRKIISRIVKNRRRSSGKRSFYQR